VEISQAMQFANQGMSGLAAILAAQVVKNSLKPYCNKEVLWVSEEFLFCLQEQIFYSAKRTVIRGQIAIRNRGSRTYWGAMVYGHQPT
jgi:hypothetical protein